MDVDALADEMSAVASFARSTLTAPDTSAAGLKWGAGATSSCPTQARERRTVLDGKYELAVGWASEPVIQGQQNAACIHVQRAESGLSEPVDGVEESLRVRLCQGGESREFPIHRVPEKQGEYAARFVPARAGEYRFVFVGSIEGHPVDETFDGTDGQFGSVEPALNMQFPSDIVELTQADAPVHQDQPSLQSTRLLAAAGLSAGFLGILGAIANWRAHSGRASQNETAMRTTPSDNWGPQAPVTTVGDGATAETIDQDFGPALQEQIDLALRPLVAEFRQEIARSVREQTEQAFILSQGGGAPKDPLGRTLSVIANPGYPAIDRSPSYAQ